MHLHYHHCVPQEKLLQAMNLCEELINNIIEQQFLGENSFSVTLASTIFFKKYLKTKK